MKQSIIIMLAIAIMTTATYAHEGMEEELEIAKQIIDSKTPCNELTDIQLEMIGDYYMEQMHPGEQHETVEEMMGGEGTESLRQVHIGMGKAMYCGEQDAMPAMMMNMMMNNGMNNAGFSRGLTPMQRDVYTGVPSYITVTAAILATAAVAAAFLLWQRKKTGKRKK